MCFCNIAFALDSLYFVTTFSLRQNICSTDRGLCNMVHMLCGSSLSDALVVWWKKTKLELLRNLYGLNCWIKMEKIRQSS